MPVTPKMTRLLGETQKALQDPKLKAAMDAYDKSKAEVEALMKEIADDLKTHAKFARQQPQHGWGLVGDMDEVKKHLKLAAAALGFSAAVSTGE